MRVVILGCGRVGSTLALMLDLEGMEVSVIDKDPDSFQRLGESFRGKTVAGLGIDVEVLQESGIEGADAFFAVTNGDNTNIMASQIAKVKFGVPKVFARIYDPLRAQVYRELGIETVSATMLVAGMLFDRLFDRPYRDVADYLQLTHQAFRLYAANLPAPEQISAHQIKSEGKRPSYIIVAGGGKVGYQLTKALLQEGYEVLLVEKRPQRYYLLRDDLGETVFYGDACEIRTMAQIGMERADLVIAVTGDDEDNLVFCQVAKRWFGVPRAIARVNTPTNEEIFHMLGIDETISATNLLFQLVEQVIAISGFLPLALLRRSGLEIVEMKLTENSPAVGKPVRELNLPQGCLLIALVRGESAQVVVGETVLQPSDTVLALANPDAARQMRKIIVKE
ncbi:MAG: NAD-binding protein [Armatimonadetes bacterium]|nr:NAD-binding protein [Armatimonadota bacterium]MDW8027848.1 NAD-binding protein [Armatimonadota bacterium]